jgi:hypothetical protein
MNWKAATILLASITLSGCYSPEPASLTSKNAPSLIPAIKQAADQNDRSAIPLLVQDLDDHDSAVRFAAINALRQMTEQDFDYHYYVGKYDRQAAIGRWQQWLKENPQPKEHAQ